MEERNECLSGIDIKDFTHCIEGKDTKVPFQSLTQCVSYMLHDMSIRRDVKGAMEVAIGSGTNIADVGVLESLLVNLKHRMSSGSGGTYVLEGIHSGYGYLQNLVETRNVWATNWNVAATANMKKLIVSLALYEDDFSKFKGSKVKDTIFEVCCLEATATGTTLKSIGTQCIMLAPASGPSKFDSLYWSQFTKDVRDLASGVAMDINGEVYMVFVPLIIQTGDTPAVKRSLGFHPNVTNIKFPCRLCYTTEANFGPSILDSSLVGELRTAADLQNMVNENKGAAGPFITEELRLKYYNLGILEVAAQYAEWPNHMDAFRMTIDTMHLNSLGTCKKFFELVMDVLTVGIANKNGVYVDLSTAFQRYCRLNGLHSVNCRWKSKDQFFKSTVNAWSKKEFFKVSPFILWVHPLLVPDGIKDETDERKLVMFQYWTMYCQCVSIMNQRTISSSDVLLLERWLPKILEFLQTLYQEGWDRHVDHGPARSPVADGNVD